jgi:hypothetical protein
MGRQLTGTRPPAASASRVPLVAVLLVQIFVGYEWFMSGLTKIVRGGFPSGLGKELTDKSSGAAHWYRSLLDGSIIPNSSVFGYLIEVGELLIGVALIGAALGWLLRWERLSRGGRLAVLGTTVLAAFAGIFMAVNFHLANGAPHPWLVPRSGFDEGVDLDSLLPLVQLVLIGVSVAYWRSLRSTKPHTAPQRSRVGWSRLRPHKGV